MLSKSIIGLTFAGQVLTAAIAGGYKGHGNGYGNGHGQRYGSGNNTWAATDFQSLVSFGDSYTDDSRLSYFINNNGSAPPVGWVNPANYASATGGRPWPQYVSQYAGITIYNYAVSGATCSNNIIYRYFAPVNGPFPDVEGYEIPAYLADKAYTVPETGEPFLDIPPEQTVYSMWIGTNDLGNNAFIDDSQIAGTNITSYVDCVYTQIGRLYDSGARYFVLQNIAPLQLSPLYGLPEAGGVVNSNFWPEKPANTTQISGRMLEQVVTVNEIYDLRTAVEVQLQRKYPGANFALFSVYDLITDIYYNPSQYLNGTAPLDVTGVTNKCDVEGVCVRADNPDSRLWYDDLHPSEQTDRVIAREFINVLDGSSEYATYYSA